MKSQFPGWHNGLGALQWFVYMLVYSIPIPIVIGGLFHLPAAEIEGLMQRTFLVAGLATILQGTLGHRRPIIDGPAGIWLSVFVILGDMAMRSSGDPSATLSLLTGGMILAGVLLLLISRVAHRIAMWFTPLVTGSFMLLLSFQLGGVFLKGMLGAGHGPLTSEHTLSALLAFGVFVSVLGLSVWGAGWWKSYAVLIGIAVGWLAFACLGQAEPAVSDVVWFRLPEVLVWGFPQLDVGMAVAILPLILMVLASTMAATDSMDHVLEKKAGADPRQVFRSTAVSGVTHVLSALFATVGIVPLGGSAGYVRMTGQKRMAPFLAGGLIMACLAFMPAIIRFLTTMPAQVAYAVELAAFVPMIGLGVRAILREPMTERRLLILGVTLMVGTAILFLPAETFSETPAIVQYIAGNGLLVGVLLALVLERLWKEKAERESAQKKIAS
ncbi:purine/pyrimidine permease [Brevibacillus centrosporus]|uniref:purine/pyrimidine permease n=1 Tax=Brevibacillus centrosporus TaxID=54910 RepID=UPI002E235903|nr:purine/pyrimidine permease [Brevibacillus centrosporus]MED1952808.1 purine/pyrimidine permease [Brevibacillus centrosporus]